MTFGYARVSTKEQNLDRQLEQLRQYVQDERNIIVDKASGKDFERKGYNSLVGTDETAPMLREGDLLVVVSLDRLGRNYDEMRIQWQHITQTLKADIKVLDMPLLDTAQNENSLERKFIADIVFQILSYVSERERLNIRERQRQGIEIAKAQGKYKGKQPKKIDLELLKAECAKWRRGEQTATETMKKCGLTKTLFYDRVKKYGL